MMAAMAAQTTRVRVAILVTGVTYRHPAVAAKIAATIDHISGGRAEYGVGAAWFEEHRQYGIPFPRLGVRMDMLDEACRVMRGLWTEDRFSFDGEHYRLDDAQLEPTPLQARLPLMIGGAGEKRTLRIVAEHADVWTRASTRSKPFATSSTCSRATARTWAATPPRSASHSRSARSSPRTRPP
jgi:alkanesulfonate monooxygenase SsuD/methylene tetrahydromethanopterin reductase-like flavin-dependent oxidoreductase (luciferase family)